MNKVTVQIYGQDYTITGSRSESEIRKIADRVDQQMKAISKASSYSGTSNIAVLSAINISEALLDAEKEVRKMLDKAKKNTKQTRESAGEQEQKIKEYEEMLRQASEKCKEYENSIFDLQMANVKLKNEIDKLKGEQ